MAPFENIRNSVRDEIPLQIVFQGGGAKLCALMAVCDVLKEYADEKRSKERLPRIKLTRIGGTSAGAIAAVMLASNRSIDEYIRRLKEIAPKHIQAMKAFKITGYCRVAFGKPFVGSFRLEDVFSELFCTGKEAPKELKDLPVDVEIYATDMYKLSASPTHHAESIPIALANSCRIPYFFSGYASNTLLVDGGLALNLPVDRFKANESTLGSVLGISFGSSFGQSSFKGVRDYTEQLFNAAIQSNVERSIGILGRNNVFFTTTDMNTLDFEVALREGFGEKYELVQLQFRSWLDNKLREIAPNPEPTSNASPFVYPILTNAPWASAVVEELNERARSDRFTNASAVASFDTAILDKNGEFAGRYRSRFRTKYRVVKKSHILAFDFQAGNTGATFSDLKLRIMVHDAQGRALKFATHVQELPVESELRSFRMYLLFDTALLPETPNQPFSVVCEYEVDDPFPNLGSRPEFLSITRVDGVADEMIIAAAFPSKKLRKNHEFADMAATDAQRRRSAGYDGDTAHVPSTALDPGDFISELGLTTGTEHYSFHCRKATGVGQGEAIGFIVE